MDEPTRSALRLMSLYTLACICGSLAITALVTYLATGNLRLGIGMFIAVLAPAILVPIGSYFHISMAARLRAANELLRTLSETDPLTGICNRRHFLEIAESQLALARRHRFPSSVLVLDFDRFKTINDRYGHLAGDLVLVEASRIVRDVLRDSDTLARFGGEEFICLLPCTGRDGALTVAQRIRQAINATAFRHGGHDIRATVSIGGATCDTSDTSLERMTSRADALLYQAKQDGRDRYMIEALPCQGALTFDSVRQA